MIPAGLAYLEILLKGAHCVSGHSNFMESFKKKNFGAREHGSWQSVKFQLCKTALAE